MAAKLAVAKGAKDADPPAAARLSRRRNRERDVVEAALRVFYEKGYSQATMQDIADSLGMLKGSIYHYIDSKEDLLYRVLALTHDDVDAILADTAALDGISPWEQLRTYVRRIAAYSARNLAWITVYYNDLDRLSHARYVELLARRRAHERFVADTIQRATATDSTDPGRDATLLTNFAFGALLWIYRWYRPGGKVDVETLADACADFVVRGAGGPPPG